MGKHNCAACAGPFAQAMGCLLMWEEPENDHTMFRQVASTACKEHIDGQKQFAIDLTVKEIGDHREIVMTHWTLGNSVNDVMVQLKAMQSDFVGRDTLKWQRVRIVS